MTNAPRALQPDYIALQGPNQATVILEAKGTQSRGYCQARQIPRGCQQVQAVSILNRVNCLRVVVGVELQREGQRGSTTIFIGDPNEESPYAYEFAESIESVVTQGHYLRVASLLGDSPLFTRMRAPEETFRKDEGELIKRSVAGRAAPP